MGWLRRIRPSPVLIEESIWDELIDSADLVSMLAVEDRSRLRELASGFVTAKRFHGAAGHVVDEHQRVTIAAMACLPTLRLDDDSLRGWTDIIIYPGEFRSRREHHDEVTGVVTEADEDMIGEAWEDGPVVLSWSDVVEDLEHPGEGCNVVIHEIAHKLDMLDGAMNGIPKLPMQITRPHWIKVMQVAYDEFSAAVDRSDDVLIDPYAADSPAEFFAVVSEYHHSAPRLLQAQMPAVADLMATYYGGARPT